MSTRIYSLGDASMKRIIIVLLTLAVLFAVSGPVQASKLIPLPAGFNQGMGRAINESDQVVGVMWYDPIPYRDPLHPFAPFIYYNDGGTAQALAGYDPGVDYNVQDLSNTADLVVGYTLGSGTP